MKLIVVLPAIVILVSLCASPVPGPPSDVSGIVFFDANRNGIQDACDGGSPVGRYVVLANDEITLKEPAGRPEGFVFEDVPHGDYVLSLAAPSGSFWPVTTTPKGEFATTLTLEGKDISGLELGVATLSPWPSGPRVLGLAYEDVDGDGVIDPGECGIPGAGAVGPEGVSWADPFGVSGAHPFPASAGSFYLESDVNVFPSMTVSRVGTHDSWWTRTRPPSMVGQCASPVAPQPRYAEDVFELNVGFQLAHGSASVNGVLFIDSDDDGVRDADERLFDGTVQLTPACTGEYRPLVVPLSTGADGYEFAGLPAGDYILTVAYLGQVPDGVAQPVVKELRVTVADGERATADYPHRVVPSGTLIVYRYEDGNGNGQFDGDLQEPLVPNTPACYREIDSDHEECAEPQQVLEGITLPMGTYEVHIPYTDGVRLPRTAEVRAGETVTLFFAARTNP